MIDGRETSGGTVVCTQDGLWTLEGSRIHASAFAGRNVITGTATHSRFVLVVDDRDLWELAEGHWRRIATADCLVHSLLYSADQTLIVAGADGRLGSLRNHEIEWSTQVGDLAARGQWRTPWGGPPDIHTLTRASDDGIYACVHAGWIIRSDDEGASWRQLRDGLASDVHDVEPHPHEPTTLLVATAEGAYLSEDGGAHFRRRWPSPVLQYLRACAIFGKDDVWMVSAHDNAKRGSRAYVLRSHDRGTTWTSTEGIPEHATGHINTITTLDDHTALALSPGRMFASHDQGASWQTFDNGVPRRRFDPKLHFVNPIIKATSS